MSDVDAVVIGGGVNGLVAALYLAKAKQRVLIVEAGSTLGGLCQPVQVFDGFLSTHVAHALYALDPKLLKDFRSVRRGLTFAARDLPLIGVSEHGEQVIVSRDGHATARSIAVHSQPDGVAWPRFRKELFGLARAMRKLWWDGKPFDASRLKRAHQTMYAALQTQSAAAWLDGWFESDLLKATLAFDASGGLLLEPGSALPLAWRAAQEMCGLQGAVAVPNRSAGALTRLLGEAVTAAGIAVRTSLHVERLVIADGQVAGVVLNTGETIACRTVFSSQSRRNALLGCDETPFEEARRLSRTAAATSSALVTIALDDVPKIGGASQKARFVTADKLETIVAAEMASRAGHLPAELVFETIVSSSLDTTVAPPDRHLVSCLVRPLPLAPHEGWIALKPKLTAKVIAALDRMSPGLVPHVISVDAIVPCEYTDENDPVTPECILARWRERVCTSIPGLYLCGAGAEPMAAVSGRAGRIAAAMALSDGGAR